MTMDAGMQALQQQVHREHEARQQALLDQLEARTRRAPREARAWYELGVVRLEAALSWTGPGLLPAAQAALRQAIALAPGDAKAHALLGRCLDAQDQPGEALEAFVRAADLDPDDKVFQAAVATLATEHLPEAQARPLVEAGARASALALPPPATPLRDLVRNLFVHARNHLDSRLRKEQGRIEKRHGGRSLDELMAQELADTQKALEKEVVRSRVPRQWRHLTAWAQRLGVGDDGLRGRAVEQLDTDDAQRLLCDMAPHEAAITAWTAGLGEPMPPEGAAFLYLQLAVEEIRAARAG
jgi:hypothetical protein